jgi:hypothetical protein
VNCIGKEMGMKITCDRGTYTFKIEENEMEYICSTWNRSIFGGGTFNEAKKMFLQHIESRVDAEIERIIEQNSKEM